MVKDAVCTPRLTLLSDGQRNRIHLAALKILTDIGMKILHDAAMDILKNAGCRIDRKGIVTIPDTLVHQALESAPGNIAVYDRTGVHRMDVGERRSYFGTGSDLMYTFDATTETRRLCTLEDVAQAARVADALANIDFIMSFAFPSDHPPELGHLMSFWKMATHSIKPIVCTARGRRDLQEMWEISRILRDGEAPLRSKPYFIHYAEPSSPLKHLFDSVDKLLFCAEKSIPVIYSPAPIAGSTAPMTIAGHVVQGLAEALCGLVIHQQKAPGAPFLIGMGPAVLDMKTLQCTYNAPEYLLAHQAMIEMSQFYGLPNWGYAGTTDSQLPDEQAVFEAGVETYLSALAGSNLNHDIGYMDFGRTGCLEMLVILDEIIDQARRFMSGFSANDDDLALEVVRAVGADGNFLTHPHTVKHVRRVQWQPTLISRMGYERWQSIGSTRLIQRTRQRLREILAQHQPAPVPDHQLKGIQERMDRCAAVS